MMYLDSLPGKKADPQLNRFKLIKPLPEPVHGNKEIQPLRGAAQ